MAVDRLREDAVTIVDEEDEETSDDRKDYKLNACPDLGYTLAT